MVDLGNWTALFAKVRQTKQNHILVFTCSNAVSSYRYRFNRKPYVFLHFGEIATCLAAATTTTAQPFAFREIQQKIEKRRESQTDDKKCI